MVTRALDFTLFMLAELRHKTHPGILQTLVVMATKTMVYKLFLPCRSWRDESFLRIHVLSADKERGRLHYSLGF